MALRGRIRERWVGDDQRMKLIWGGVYGEGLCLSVLLLSEGLTFVPFQFILELLKERFELTQVFGCATYRAPVVFKQCSVSTNLSG